MGQWFQRFVASGLHGEVSDATIQGYLRSASQLEDIWQQIDDDVDAFIAQGIAPWDAYARMGYALAYVRACRTNVVFVQELLKADAAAEPASAGYLPKITYDQALALCEHIEPYLEEAIKASTNSRYVPTTYALPLTLGPHIRYANQHFPLPHLQGIIGAAQQTRDWAAGLLAKYELALRAAKTPVPQPVSTHVEEMRNELGLGDFHLRTGVDMVGQISNGQTTDELSKKADGFLWEAMQSFFKVSQLVAISGTPAPARPSRNAPGIASHEQTYQRPAAPKLNPEIPVPPAPKPNPEIPAPPSPDMSDMLNQVITAPGAVQQVPAPSLPDVSDILNQVITDRGGTQAVPASPSPDVSDMLNQVITDHGGAQAVPASPSPDASDMLNQVIADAGMTQEVPRPPLTRGPDAVARASQPDKSTSGDNVLDMLSEICGEQKNNE